MTLEEAIHENQTTLCVPNSEFLTPKYQAIVMGNEALKRVLKMRTYKPTPPGMPLPGETEK